MYLLARSRSICSVPRLISLLPRPHSSSSAHAASPNAAPKSNANSNTSSSPSSSPSAASTSASSSTAPLFPVFPSLPDHRPSACYRQHNLSHREETIQRNSAMITHIPSDIGVLNTYKLLIGSVVPRPIAWVGTRNLIGQTNLAPYSFFQAISSSPACLMISITRNPNGTMKDTLRNILETKEFTVNSVSEWSAEQMNDSSAALEYGESEFKAFGVTEVESKYIKAPRVGESAIQFECRLHGIYSIGKNGSAGEIGSADVVFGEIVAIHSAPGLVSDSFHVNLDEYRPISRLAGQSYGRIGGIFELARPKKPGKSTKDINIKDSKDSKSN